MSGACRDGNILVLNGHEIDAVIDEQEQVFLSVAAGQLARDELAKWIEDHLIRPMNRDPLD